MKIGPFVIARGAVESACILVMIWWVVSIDGKAQQQPPAFSLTETESLKIENYRLKRDLLDSQLNQLYQARQQVQNEMNALAMSIMKDRGNPSHVTFDGAKGMFAVGPPKEEKKEQKK